MPTSPKTAPSSPDQRRRPLPAFLPICALIAYPFAAHYGAASAQWLPALALLAGLLLMLAINSLGWPRGVLAGAALGVATAAVLDPVGSGALLVFAQPILINLALCYLFGHTLLGQRSPLINRYIRAIRGELDEPTSRYGRHLTQVWTLLFAALALECLLLAVFASHETWSLVSGFLNYLLIAALFVAEYQVRIRVLSHLHHDSFGRFLLALSRCPPSTLLKD